MDTPGEWSSPLVTATRLRWTQDVLDPDDRVVEMTHVHKQRRSNVLLQRARWLTPEPDRDVCHGSFLFQLLVDPGHEFFFEHPRGHVPGLLLVEAGRQAGMAVCHLYCNVDSEVEFVLDDLGVSFMSMGSLTSPIFILLRFADKEFRKDRLAVFTQHIWFVQGNRSLGTMQIRARTLSKKLFARLESQVTSDSPGEVSATAPPRP
jgi:hypothetical protein